MHDDKDNPSLEPVTRLVATQGFTLIELLVVILIISILAAIAIPSFLSQRDKAHDADAKAAAGLAALAMETYGTGNNGYDGAQESDLIEIEPVLNDTPSLDVVSATNNTYELSTVSDSDTGTVFTVARGPGGSTTHSCFPSGQSGCPNGLW